MADATHHVVAVVFDGYQPLDLSGPMELLDGAARAGLLPRYEIRLASPDGGQVTAQSGLRIDTDQRLADGGPIDTLLVVGGFGTAHLTADDRFLADLRALAARAGRITSVCTGALLLGAAGLLDGRSATTHWQYAHLLRTFPNVEVDPDRLWVRDGDVWTSAGVTAGIDLYLAILEEDHGVEVAHEAARRLVVFAQRPGGQQQFSSHLRADAARSEPVRDLQRWIPDHLDADLTVAALARHAGLSTRTLCRRFRDEVGHSPAEFVELARIEAARNLLESTDLTVGTIARRVGLGSGETLHRAFVRRMSTTPARYRSVFNRRVS
ncbi:MAG: DJ-1/PfpI family protein [Actinomycetota bacterium]